jgi:hypothetical protein
MPLPSAVDCCLDFLFRKKALGKAGNKVSDKVVSNSWTRPFDLVKGHA